MSEAERLGAIPEQIRTHLLLAERLADNPEEKVGDRGSAAHLDAAEELLSRYDNEWDQQRANELRRQKSAA